MTKGFFSSLSPVQQEAALAYDGPENHGPDFFAENANKSATPTDAQVGLPSEMPGSEPGMATHAKIASVQTGLPSEEEIARALIAHFVKNTGFQTVNEDDTKTSVAAYYGGHWVDLRIYPIARAILALFPPILAEKEREIAEAQAELAKLMDPELKHLRIEDGSIDLALTGPIVQHMGLVISEHFRASGAENYIEMSYHAKTEPFETYVWTIQKRVGSNSPHDLRARAEARALAAEAALAAGREEGFRAGVEKACDTKRWTTEMSHAWHRAVPDVPKAFADLAAAIRAQGE